MMLTEEQKEIEKNAKTKKALEIEINSFKNNFAKELINGVGEDIKRNINNPIKISKRKKLWLKIKRFFNLLIDTL